MKKPHDPLRLWLTLMGAGAAVSLAAALCTHGQALVDSLYGKGHGYLMDYFTHIAYVDDPARVYESTAHACFPPLAYCLYYLLRMISTVMPENGWLYHTLFRADYPSLLVYTVYSCLLAAAVCMLLRRWLHRRSTGTALLTAGLLLLSNVFVAGLLERGNSAYIALALLIAALLLRDSPQPWKREAALILIALAAGLKLYPAVFGLLYLKEKRWREAARLVAYGLLFFFVPFVFFGGWNGFLLFLQNQRAIQLDSGNGWSVDSLVRALLRHAGLGGEAIAAPAVSLLFAAFCLFGAYRTKETWRELTLLTALFVFLPRGNGYYVHCYWLLPLLSFFSTPQPRRASFVFPVLFAALFLPMVALSYESSLRFTAAAAYLVTLGAGGTWGTLRGGFSKRSPSQTLPKSE